MNTRLGSPRPRSRLLALCAAVAAVVVVPLAAGGQLAHAGPARAAQPASAPPASGLAANADAPPVAAELSETDQDLVLTVPATDGSPGYAVTIARTPFRVTTTRGDEPVLQTTAAQPATFDFRLPSGTVAATDVVEADWDDGALVLQVATDAPGYTVEVRLVPETDRYRLTASVQGEQSPSWVALHYAMDASGHWFGHGETKTTEGGPYRDQAWPLDDQSDAGLVTDTAFGPASYNMIEPFWFTEDGSGFYVDTADVMTATLGGEQAGVAGFLVNDTATFDHTVFVERTARDVYEDYIGITGTPEKSDAPDYQYRTPVWNSWAQFYTDVTQADFLAWARGIHDAGIPAHTFNLDDGWMSRYGDFTFNAKFPDPKAMADAVHDLGYRFGLWVTLWINLDADNYQVAKERGYLLKSKENPAEPCSVSWWNGTAGIVDLANPEARDWYVGQLEGVQQEYGVDGFKFDTRFFDERCAPYEPGLSMADYQGLGAAMADQFDLQGMGIRVHWTGSQRHGFVTRQIDKSTDWKSLQAAVSQNLALSTVGYPFVTTDMIGGSLGGFPPSKEVLVRWSQAAAVMPLMYSSTSPLGVTNFAGSRQYDEETVRLYREAVRLHERLAPYILEQVDRATASGEPIMKPLFFNFAGDRATYTVDDQWLLGDSLMVAPMLEDARTRDIHVPAGRWYDVVRQRAVEGPTDLRGYRAGLATLPAFVRLGAPETGSLMRALAPGEDGAVDVRGSRPTP